MKLALKTNGLLPRGQSPGFLLKTHSVYLPRHTFELKPCPTIPIRAVSFVLASIYSVRTETLNLPFVTFNHHGSNQGEKIDKTGI